MQKPDNVIFVGNKSPMDYVPFVITQFHNGNSEIKIKARGRAISVAVDVAEIVRNKFLPGIKIGNVAIATESVTSEKGEKMNISSIEISLLR